MPDGLDQLDSKRRQSHRLGSIPPSRHKPRETPVAVAAGAATVDAVPAPPTPVQAPQSVPVSQQAGEDLVHRRSIFLSPVDDAFLESVFETGRFDPAGRFDASKSAVVRLALARLAKDFSAAEVVGELRRNAPTPTNGRPRH